MAQICIREGSDWRLRKKMTLFYLLLKKKGGGRGGRKNEDSVLIKEIHFKNARERSAD